MKLQCRVTILQKVIIELFRYFATQNFAQIRRKEYSPTLTANIIENRLIQTKMILIFSNDFTSFKFQIFLCVQHFHRQFLHIFISHNHHHNFLFLFSLSWFYFIHKFKINMRNFCDNFLCQRKTCWFGLISGKKEIAATFIYFCSRRSLLFETAAEICDYFCVHSCLLYHAQSPCGL